MTDDEIVDTIRDLLPQAADRQRDQAVDAVMGMLIHGDRSYQSALLGDASGARHAAELAVQAGKDAVVKLDALEHTQDTHGCDAQA